MTIDEIVAVLRPVDETVIADILKTGATAQELSIDQGRAHPSGRVAELVGILESIERDVEA